MELIKIMVDNLILNIWSKNKVNVKIITLEHIKLLIEDNLVELTM